MNIFVAVHRKYVPSLAIYDVTTQANIFVLAHIVTAFQDTVATYNLVLIPSESAAAISVALILWILVLFVFDHANIVPEVPKFNVVPDIVATFTLAVDHQSPSLKADHITPLAI